MIGKVAVLVLCTNEKHFLEECFNSLLAQTYPNLSIYMLDNNSSDGSVDFVAAQFGAIRIVEFDHNMGYARGNNRGMEIAFGEGADLCLVLNNDIQAPPEMIQNLIQSFTHAQSEKHRVGLLQPTILLYDQPEKVNTIGNAIHFLGYGYCKNYLEQYIPLDTDREIASVSGAALLISRDYFQDVGGFDESFFIYNEDQDLSWRGLLKGYKHFVSARSILYHKYSFHRRKMKIYHSEKNRLMILLANYELKTLILLMPGLLLNEFAAVVYSIASRCFLLKLKSYFYVFTHLSLVLQKRRRTQKDRSVSDKSIFPWFESLIQTEVMKNPLVDYILNPFFKLYYHSLSRIL